MGNQTSVSMGHIQGQAVVVVWGQFPEYAVEEYRQYVADGKGKRGWMMVVADIEDETEKLKKIKQRSTKLLLRQ
jgi:hypothetical protein